MPRMASECSGPGNDDALPNKAPKVSPERLTGFARLRKYLNSVELNVLIDKFIPGRTNWLVQLEDVGRFRRIALSNIVVVGRSWKDAVIQCALKRERIRLFQVDACGIRRRVDADGQADR